MRTPELPTEKYDIIYADPPWEYSNGDRIRSAKDHSYIDVNDHYETLSMEDLKQLDIGSIANDNSLLFSWLLSPLLKECIEVCESWGFTFRTIAFVWNKLNTHVGYYTMSNCELCGVFKRGKIPEPRGSWSEQQFLETAMPFETLLDLQTHYIAALRGKHSEKPKQIRERIGKVFPKQAKIELFARPDWTDYERGWDFWGNEC